MLRAVYTAHGRYDRIYLNLTDGLALARGLGRVDGPVVVTRLKSSHLERQAFERFLWTVPDDMFYALVRGFRVLFVDAGSRREDGVTRTVWMGIPLIIHAVSKLVFRAEASPAAELGVLRPAVASHVDRVLAETVYGLPEPLRARIKYYRRFARTLGSVDCLVGRGAVDRDYEGYAHRLDGLLRRGRTAGVILRD